MFSLSSPCPKAKRKERETTRLFHDKPINSGAAPKTKDDLTKASISLPLQAAAADPTPHLSWPKPGERVHTPYYHQNYTKMSSSSRPITILALALAFTTFLLPCTTAKAARPPPTTPPLCQTSEYPAVCTKIARSINPLTPETLAEASVNAAASKAIRARAAAARLSYSMRNQTIQQYLGVCRNAYTEALGNLQAATALLKTTRNRDDIMANLSAAAHSVASCEKNFREVHGMAFPLRRVNSCLTKMVKNSVAMGSQLK